MKSCIIFVVLVLSWSARAAVTQFTTFTAWQSAAGDFSTITFTEFPEGTLVTDHYANLGITFTDGIDLIWHNEGFDNDGAGLNGAFDSTAVEFAEPQFSIGVHFPGFVKFKLYSDGQLIFTSNDFSSFPPTNHAFAGLVSTQAFDAVIISDPTSGLFIDDLYFGPPIPAPGGLALLSLGGLLTRSRRRMS